MKNEYKTVAKTAITEFEERKSRFIAHLSPVKTEEEAISFISKIKTKYWDATHNVYAYILDDGFTQRYSDDGEPSGTAGIPVLEVLKKRGLQDVVVVVTRYFGGILLGAGGLVRAYGKSASEGVDAAIPIKRVKCSEIVITVEYSLLAILQNMATEKGYTIGKIEYAQDAEITFYIEVGREKELSDEIIDSTNANCLIEEGNHLFITLDENGKLMT